MLELSRQGLEWTILNNVLFVVLVLTKPDPGLFNPYNARSVMLEHTSLDREQCSLPLARYAIQELFKQGLAYQHL